jgi:hypothetical protein
MPTRTKKKWKADSRGRYPRELGYKQNERGELVPHKFYLGEDVVEAQRRNVRLEELWEVIERDHEIFNWPVEWNSLTMMIGREIAKGNYQITMPRKGNDPDAYARYLHRLQNSFRMVTFVPEPVEQETYKLGAEMARQKGTAALKRRVREFRSEQEDRLLRSGAITDAEVCGGEDTLHEAFDEYIRQIKEDDVLPGTTELTDYGHMKIKNVARLMERHDNVSLSSISTFDAVQSMVNVWRNRPMVKNSDPPTPITKKTAEHHIAELMRFFRWLNRTSQFPWRKPPDFDEIKTKVNQSAAEKAAKHNHTQVDTYRIEELLLLNEYATPLERLLLLLGLNCGFGAAEQGRIALKNLHLNQTHPNAELLSSLQGYQSNDNDSFLCMLRPKSGVYAEWRLWPQTVEVIKWARKRREEIGNAGPDALLLITERGTPFLKQSSGGNRSQNFNRRWSDLTKRVKADFPNFPVLSFGKLRKTAGNLVRVIADGEISGVFLCHGKPVETDDLSDVYTDRPFAKVFEALSRLEAKLTPVFDAAPRDLFTQPMQQYTGLKKAKRILQLHEEGKPVREIAEAVGLSKTTVHRHLQRHESQK